MALFAIINKNQSPYIIAILLCLTIIPTIVNSGVIPKPYENSNRNINDDIKFYLYTRENPLHGYILVPGNDTNFADSPFKFSRSTVFYIHGFTEKYSDESGQTLKNAYVENGKYNFIIVDWSELARGPAYHYLRAVKNTVIVGPHVAHMLKWLESQQAIQIKDIHIIGFSLGAHVAAFAGEELARNRSEKIYRITGLDPAGPAWDKLGIQTNGLDKADANFVDIIHTNTKTLGIKLAIGHADFYMNLGKTQPGCSWISVSCSHGRAWQYFAESLSNPFGFPAAKCEKWDPTPSNCVADSNVYMGFAVSVESVGIFAVATKSKTPFSEQSIPYIEALSSSSSGKDILTSIKEIIPTTNGNTFPESLKLSYKDLSSKFDSTKSILKEGKYRFYPALSVLNKKI